ncbi:MAG TPA: site-2 protease family protein [Actinomycetota bacterium]|nr:site-2 protease family protein [Actinomycetota bacterium]
MGSGGSRWKVATVRGIPLYVSTSWFIIAGLYVWLRYEALTRILVEPAEAATIAVLGAVLFFGSVLLHEAAHAVMARSIDLPVSGITLVFWGGATETKASAKGPLGEFLVAFVGPATTLVLAGVFWFAETLTNGLVAETMGSLAELSLIFAAFNALPGFPLDGGRMLLAIVWGVSGDRRTAMRIAGYGGIAIGVAIGAVAIWMLVNKDLTWAIFLGYIAMILIATGRAMDHRIAVRDQLVQGTVRDAMRSPPSPVPADMSLVQALDDYLRGADGQGFPVVDAGRVIGTISIDSARKVGARDPMRPVRDGVRPLAQTPVLAPDETLDEAVEWLGGREGLVLRDGVLVGALGPGDVERWYRRVIEGHPDGATGHDGSSSELPSMITPAPGSVPPRPDLP